MMKKSHSRNPSGSGPYRGLRKQNGRSSSSLSLLFFAVIVFVGLLFVFLVAVPDLDPSRGGSIDLTAVERTRGKAAIVYKSSERVQETLAKIKEKIGSREPSIWKPEDFSEGLDGDIVLDRLKLPRPPYKDLQEFLNLKKIPYDPIDRKAKWSVLQQFVKDFAQAYESASQGRQYRDFFGANLGKIYGEWTTLLASAPSFPEGGFSGRGIVIPGGGLKYIISVYVNIRLLRFLGCRLPIEVWMLPKELPQQDLVDIFLEQGAVIRHTGEIGSDATSKAFTPNGFAFKAASIVLSSFEEVLMLDADINPIGDPTELFHDLHYQNTGVVLWKDFWRQHWSEFDLAQVAFNLSDAQVELWSGGNSGIYPGAYILDEPISKRRFSPFEFTYERVHTEHMRNHARGVVYTHDSGIMLVNKRKVWRAMMFYLYMNIRAEIFHNKVTVPNGIGSGDKETLPMALRVLKMPYYLVETPVGIAGKRNLGHTMVQYRPGTTRPMFLHRNCLKWRPGTIVQTNDRTWEAMVHIPPSLHTRSENRVDALFWKCAVNANITGFVRQPFQNAVSFDVELAAQHFGMDLVTQKAYDRYSIEQSRARGKYVSMFGHKARSATPAVSSDEASAGSGDGAAEYEGQGGGEEAKGETQQPNVPSRRSRLSLRRGGALNFE